MKKHVAAAVEGILDGRLKVVYGRYLSDEELGRLSDEDLDQLLDIWSASKRGWGYKSIAEHACMGLPLQNEVESRWRAGRK